MKERTKRIQELVDQVDYEKEFAEEIEELTEIDEISYILEDLTIDEESTENIKMLATIFLDDIQQMIGCLVCGSPLRLRGAEIARDFGELSPNLSPEIRNFAHWYRTMQIVRIISHPKPAIQEIAKILRDPTESETVKELLKKFRAMLDFWKFHRSLIGVTTTSLLNIIYAKRKSDPERNLASAFLKYLLDPKRQEKMEEFHKFHG